MSNTHLGESIEVLIGEESAEMWCCATVSAVLIDGWFSAHIVLPDGSDDWDDWFTWKEEHVDWRRATTSPKKASPNSASEASRAIWETDQIENDDRVDHVLRGPRVAAALPTLVFENDEWVTAKSGATEAPAAEGAAAVEAKPSRPDDSVIEVQSAQHTVSSILEVTAFTNATGLPYSLVLDGITTMSRVRNAIGRGADSDDSLCEDLLSVIPVPWASETPAMLQDDTSQGVTVNSIQESRFIEIRNELAAQTSLDVFVGRTVTDEEAAAESAPEQEPDAPMYRRTWWGELVPIPTDTSHVFYYDWSQPTTFYAAISSSCLPAHIKNVTCSLRFRVVNEKDGATLSNPVTRLVRVTH